TRARGCGRCRGRLRSRSPRVPHRFRSSSGAPRRCRILDDGPRPPGRVSLRLMTRRRVLEVEGVSHRAPIPMGVEIGGLVFSSAVAGPGPATRGLPPRPARPGGPGFDHARALLAAAGTGPEAVARMTVYVRDDAYREDVNREWLKMFPDEHDRPARHILRWDLQDGMLIQCELVAVLAPR